MKPHITIHNDLIQGSDEWLAARCGLLTASEMKLIVTPTLKVASNDKERAHMWELMSQRITQYVEPTYIGFEMLRGEEDEVFARAAYSEHYAPTTEAGFITNNRWGYTIGYSPDGLVGDDGLIEVKSRRQKYQIETITTNVMPTDYFIQCQTGLLVSERQWLDFVSYSAGLPMCVIRVHPDPAAAEAIVNAAGEFERRLAEKLALYQEAIATRKMVPTERRVEVEMFVGTEE